MKEKFGWLLRHYGVQRLVVIALAWPVYHVAWFFVQLFEYGQRGASLAPVAPLSTGTYDIWFGFWVASVSVPLLWIASYKLPVIEMRWAFRLIVLTWLLDGVIALGQGFWLMRGASVPTIAAALEAWACGVLLPIAVGFIPWLLLESWGRVSGLPILKRWRFTGIEEHAEWISPRKLKQHTQPLPGRTL